MDFRAIGKQVVRPGFFLHRALGDTRLYWARWHRIILRGDIPIFGSVCDAPNVPMVVERNSDKESIVA